MALRALPPRPSGPSLAERASANLHFIRTTMDRSRRFTNLSGPGITAMGGVGLLAAPLAALTSQPLHWLAVWLAAALLAATVGLLGIIFKGRAEGRAGWTAPGRRFLMVFLPPVLAGAVLTAVLVSSGLDRFLPGTWLLLYGAGVVAGGQASVPLVPATGVVFMALGGMAFLLPGGGGDVCLGAGFGATHLVAGLLIWRRHGG